MSFAGSVLNVLLWERYGSFWTWKGFLNRLWKKYSYRYVFSKDHFHGTLLFLLVETALQMTLFKLSIARSSTWYWWKGYWGECRSKFFKCEILTTDAAHTSMTPLFLLLFGILGSFLTYFITSSVGTKDNGPKPTCTGNLQPSVTFGENLRSIEHQMDPQAQFMSVRKQRFIHCQRSATICIPQQYSTIIWWDI